MSIRIMNIVWEYNLNNVISGKNNLPAKLILLKLADNASDEGMCFPSVGRIAHECSCSQSTVYRIITLLEQAKLIKRVARYHEHKQKSNEYYINIKKLSEGVVTYASTLTEKGNAQIGAIKAEEFSWD